MTLEAVLATVWEKSISHALDRPEELRMQKRFVLILPLLLGAALLPAIHRRTPKRQPFPPQPSASPS